MQLELTKVRAKCARHAKIPSSYFPCLPLSGFKNFKLSNHLLELKMPPLMIVSVSTGGKVSPTVFAGVGLFPSVSSNVDLQVALLEELQTTKCAAEVGYLVKMRIALMKTESAVSGVAFVAAWVRANKAFFSTCKSSIVVIEIIIFIVIMCSGTRIFIFAVRHIISLYNIFLEMHLLCSSLAIDSSQCMRLILHK